MAHMIQKRQRQTTIEKVREEEREREREREREEMPLSAFCH